MAYRRHYVIFTPQPAGRRPTGRVTRYRRSGRHRLGTPGTAPRNRTRRPARYRRPRHRHPARRGLSALGFSSMAGLLGTLVISGWFTVTGAAAAAQMIHP